MLEARLLSMRKLWISTLTLVLHAQAFLASSFSWKPLIHAGLICRNRGLMRACINDVPALKAADVGISVDSAVDVGIRGHRSPGKELWLVLEEGYSEGFSKFIVKEIRLPKKSFSTKPTE